MDGESFLEAVRDERATELDRLGSEKWLIAATAADLETEAVLRSVAVAEATAHETFGHWADHEPDDRAREAFADVAEQEADHRDRVAADLPETPGPEADTLHEHLRGLEGTVERVAAGLVARPLVGDRSLLQVINFFVNEADERHADLARDLRADTRAWFVEGPTVLADVCTSDEDWERAEDAATTAIDVAYEEYAETLEGMGLDPKPVC